jgi:hypothetical protein
MVCFLALTQQIIFRGSRDSSEAPQADGIDATICILTMAVFFAIRDVHGPFSL